MPRSYEEIREFLKYHKFDTSKFTKVDWPVRGAKKSQPMQGANNMTLYPIGTILKTSRLSQAALYWELFGNDNITSLWADDSGVSVQRIAGREPVKSEGFAYDAENWEVAVTPENQAYLSSAPRVEDIGRFLVGFWPNNIEHYEHGAVYEDDGSLWLEKEDINPEIIQCENNKIFSRLYPNGQRKPLIEWEEVILPNGD